MVLGVFAAKAASLMATGLAGAVALEGVRKVVGADVVRGTAVAVTALGLRGARAAETGAERARLVTADIVAEAREKIGDQVPAPGAPVDHGHDH